MVVSKLLSHNAFELYHQMGRIVKVRRGLALLRMPEHFEISSSRILLLLWQIEKPAVQSQ